MFPSVFREGGKNWSDSHFLRSNYGLGVAAFHLQHVPDSQMLYDPWGPLPAAARSGTLDETYMFKYKYAFTQNGVSDPGVLKHLCMLSHRSQTRLCVQYDMMASV